VSRNLRDGYRPISPPSRRSLLDSWIRCCATCPGLNVTTDFSGTKTLSLVLGLRALRGARRLTSKTPKLRSPTRPSSTKVPSQSWLRAWLTDLTGVIRGDQYGKASTRANNSGRFHSLVDLPVKLTTDAHGFRENLLGLRQKSVTAPSAGEMFAYSLLPNYNQTCMTCT
jgi:hypothetical protein